MDRKNEVRNKRGTKSERDREKEKEAERERESEASRYWYKDGKGEKSVKQISSLLGAPELPGSTRAD